MEHELAATQVMTRASTATYLYCICRASRRPSLARAPQGVPGASGPEAHRLSGSLWIVTATVPLDVYGPSRLEPRLSDLDWVSQAAMAHEAVVEHVARSVPVIPMKLFTLFTSLDRALADLGPRTEELQRAMRRVAGAEEWGVRVFRRPEASGEEGASRRAASGADFLRAKKQLRDAAVLARTTAAEAAALAYDRLRRCARDARLRDARHEPGSNPPILEAAFLVAAAARAKFKREAARQSASLLRAGAELVLTGPWPAYNFVTAEDGR
jgi:hypothetical protein